MTRWHAVVPIKPADARKTRLRGCLSHAAIAELTDRMLDHVLHVLAGVDCIGAVSVLATHRHDRWTGGWIADPGTGLNAALAAAAAIVSDRLVIVHADLPALQGEDIVALIGAADAGVALAPDRRGLGTNAIVLRNARGVAFAFGQDSFARHRAIFRDGSVVRRAGLALDIDVPDDLERAIVRGFLPDAIGQMAASPQR